MKKSALFGYAFGSIMAIFILFMLPLNDDWHTLNVANTGHENLECTDCHTIAPGTPRQQIQTNTKAFLGFRETGVDFGHHDVTNENCLACHDRPNDNHPVYRFNEPRFVEARQAIQPQLCESCHLEHQGRRVTIDTTFCVHCHTDLDLTDDPIDVPHVELVANEDWTSCLGCHDFHGNHVMEIPVRIENTIDTQLIEAYFENEPSPYSNERLYVPKERLDE